MISFALLFHCYASLTQMSTSDEKTLSLLDRENEWRAIEGQNGEAMLPLAAAPDPVRMHAKADGHGVRRGWVWDTVSFKIHTQRKLLQGHLYCVN